MNMDIYVQLGNLPNPGETKFASNLFKAPGGKSSNQAVAIAKYGLKPTLIAAVGDDSEGEALIELALSQGIDVSHIVKLPNVATGTAFVMVDSSAENFIVVVPGANAVLDFETVSSRIAKKSGSYKAIVAATEINPDVIRGAFKVSREESATTFLNPSPFTSEASSLIEFADFVIVNEGESKALASELKVSIDELSTALAAKNVKHLIITLGAAGCTHHNLMEGGGAKKTYAAPVIQPIDTTGCGDAFLGSLVSVFVQTGDVEESIQFALRAASFAALSQGAQTSYGHKEEIEFFFSNHNFV
jgi:ribokinase